MMKIGKQDYIINVLNVLMYSTHWIYLYTQYTEYTYILNIPTY